MSWKSFFGIQIRVTFKHPQIYLNLFCIFEKLCGKLKIGNLHKQPFSDTKVKKQLKLCSCNLRFRVKYQFSGTYVHCAKASQICLIYSYKHFGLPWNFLEYAKLTFVKNAYGHTHSRGGAAVYNFIPWNPLGPITATYLSKLCNSITRQWLELERCSNHLRIRQDI